MGYIDCWGHRVFFDCSWPHEPDIVFCPTCDSEVSRSDVHVCEWCGKVGCEECMVAEIDGWVCGETDCAKRLVAYQANINRKWDRIIEERKRR